MSTLADSLKALAKFDIPEYDLTEVASALTEEETTRLTMELSEAAEDPQNWQQRRMTAIQSWKERSPIVAGVLQPIITTVISQLLWQSFCLAAATLRDSIIREEPTSKAAVVRQIKQSKNDIMLEWFLSFVLRHSPSTAGVTLDVRGKIS